MGHCPVLVYISGVHLRSCGGRRKREADASLYTCHSEDCGPRTLGKCPLSTQWSVLSPSRAVTQFSLWRTGTSGESIDSSHLHLCCPHPSTCNSLPSQNPPPGPQRVSSSRYPGLTQQEARTPLFITERPLFLSCLFLAWRTKTERGVLIFLVNLLQLAA